MPQTNEHLGHKHTLMTCTYTINFQLEITLERSINSALSKSSALVVSCDLGKAAIACSTCSCNLATCNYKGVHELD